MVHMGHSCKRDRSAKYSHHYTHNIRSSYPDELIVGLDGSGESVHWYRAGRSMQWAQLESADQG